MTQYQEKDWCDYYLEGQAAALAGDPSTKCPHAPGWRADWWMRGWIREAKDQLKEPE